MFTKTVNNEVHMSFIKRNGMYLFTACGLGLQQSFADFSEGVQWAFTQKMAASCAADME